MTRRYVERVAGMTIPELVASMTSRELSYTLARERDDARYWAIVDEARRIGLGLPRDLAGHQPGLPERRWIWSGCGPRPSH